MAQVSLDDKILRDRNQTIRRTVVRYWITVLANREIVLGLAKTSSVTGVARETLPSIGTKKFREI